MFINLLVLDKSDLLYSDLVFLSAILQINSEWVVRNLTEDVYSRFKQLNLIKHIKCKTKTEHYYMSIRLDVKGKQLLKNIYSVSEANEDDLKIKDWLVKEYEKNGKKIGSLERIENYIVKLRLETGICRNNLAILFKHFLSEDYVDESSKVLESVFFKKTKRGLDKNGIDFYYEVPWKLEDSWIYQYYVENKNKFKSLFEEY